MLSDAAFNDDILTNLALSSISTQKKAGDRLIYKSSRVQKWQKFSESDRRGILSNLIRTWLGKRGNAIAQQKNTHQH
jgi:hypothetical protein